MAEDIIIRYRAEVDELTGEINKVIAANEKLEKSTESLSKDQTKAANESAKAYDRSADAAVKAAQAQNKAAQATVNTTKQVTAASKEADKAFQNTAKSAQAAATKTTEAFSNTASQIKNIGLGIAAGFGAAFTVDAIVNFAKTSVNAFLQAEEEAQKLEFAITSIGGESQAALERLTKQAEDLAAITYFDDDDIKRAQTALSTFGLTADQIEELIPKLADFAVVTGQDVVSAAQQVGAGLEGAGREFKKYGIEVDAASTKAENLAKISEGLVKFQDAATDSLKSQAGQVKDLKAEFGELQETIGGIILSKLGEFFTKVKNVLTPLADSVLSLARSLGIVSSEGGRLEQFGEIAGKVFTNIGRAIEPVFTVIAELINALTTGIKYVQAFAQAFVVAFNEIGKTVLTVGGGIGDVIGGIFTFDALQVKEGLDSIKRSVSQFGTDVKQAFNDAFGNGLSEIVSKQADAVAKTVEASEKLYTTEELRKKTLQELIKLQEQYAKSQTNAGRQNLEAIEKELELKKSQIAKEKALLDKFYKERLEAFKKLSADELKIVEDNLLIREALLKRTIEDLQGIPLEVPIELQVPEDRQVQEVGEQLAVNLADSIGGRINQFLQNNEEIINSAQFILGQVTELVNNATEQQIFAIEQAGQAYEEQLTKEEEALDESRNQRLISEETYQKQREGIELKRVENEKKVQAAINKERKKQAQLSKIATIFEIQIKSAQAIVEALAAPFPLNTILPAIIGALAAAQLAAAVATPIPAFAKGTKGKKGSGMALVGEEGAEMTYLPDGAKVLPAKQTKTYGEVFDAMFDNRFESYVLKKYVAPALAEQKRKFDEGKEKNFASNIVTSMQYNGLTTGDLIYANRKGTNIRNTDEIALAIAKALKTERPDLWRL